MVLDYCQVHTAEQIHYNAKDFRYIPPLNGYNPYVAYLVFLLEFKKMSGVAICQIAPD